MSNIENILWYSIVLFPLLNRIRGGLWNIPCNHFIGGGLMGVLMVYSYLYMPEEWKQAICLWCIYYFFYNMQGWLGSLNPYDEKNNEGKTNWFTPCLNFLYKHLGVFWGNNVGLAIKGLLSFGCFDLWLAGVLLPLANSIAYNPKVMAKIKIDNLAEWLFGTFMMIYIVLER